MSEGQAGSRTVTRRQALRITAVTGLAASFGGSLVAGLLRQAGLRRVSETRSQMGTVVTLTVVHPDAAAARAMIEASFTEMDRLESVFSRHREDAAVGRLNATGRLSAAPPELLGLLREAERVAAASSGAFDVTVLPVLKLYERSFAETGGAPSAAAVAAVRSFVGHDRIRIEDDAISLEHPGMAITLDGMAKGYIVDRAIEVLAAGGADRVLVNAGGDMATAGPGSVEDPWTVGVQDPAATEGVTDFVRLGGDCIATSGDYLQAFSEDRTFHHIIDPRTGYSPTETSAVSVIAPTAVMADAYSTAVLVMGPGPGVDFLNATPGVEGVIVTKSGEKIATSGMGRRTV